MAIEYIDNTNGDGAFNILGKIFHAQNTINTARGTTIKTEVQDAVNQYKKKTNADLEMDRAFEGLASAELNARRQQSGLMRQLQRTAQEFVVELVRDDSSIPQPSLDEALKYFLDGMTAGGFYVDANSVGSSVSADGGNSSTDVSIAVTHHDGDANVQQNMLAETLVIECEGSAGSVALRIRGETAVTDKLSEEWPGGSGINRLVPIRTAADSLIANGGFESSTAGVPDGWIFEPLGTGTTYRMTVFTEQTVIISGTPTSGHYNIVFTDPVSGNDYSTGNLAYNASATDVQAALRALPGLSAVTVTGTGTTPNFTHTVVFNDVAAAVAELASLEYFDTGSIAHNVTVAGDAGAVEGYGLVIEGGGDGMAIYYPISPAARTLYGASVHLRSTVSGAYSVSLEVVDGIGGSGVSSQSGGAFTSSASGTGTLNTTLKTWFAIADNAPTPVYVKVAVDAAEDVTIDDVIVASTQTLYPGGPTVVAYRGKIAPAPGDKWTVPTTNSGAGALQTMFHRNFGMAEKRKLIPTSGSTAIADSVIG